MIAYVEIVNRGERVTLCVPSLRRVAAEPILLSVSDWFENASIDQIAGYEQGESPSTTFEVDNTKRIAESLLHHPLGARVTYFDQSDVEVLSGECVRVAFGNVWQLTVEA